MGVDPGISEGAGWHQPNSYAVWAYDRGDKQEPIFLVAYEWERGNLRGVRVESVWLYEDEGLRWEEFPEFEQISKDPECVAFARLIEEGKVYRVGSMPQIGRYAEPPSWLT